MKRLEDLRTDKNCINIVRLVYTQGPIEYEKWYSDVKTAKKEFYKNDMYWPTLYINDRVILKKVSEPDRSGRLK